MKLPLVRSFFKLKSSPKGEVFFHRRRHKKNRHGTSPKTISQHIIKGSQEVPVVVIDIREYISKYKLIEGIHSKWTRNTKIIIFRYKGQWYEVTKKNVYNRWLEHNIKQ